MNINNLQEFLKYLESVGDLKIINHEVSTYLEITEISKRFLELDGPALLFNNVINHVTGKKSTFPVISNLFCSERRIENALNVKKNELRNLGELLAFLKQPEPPSSFKEAWDMIPLAKKIFSMKPSIVKKAPCQEIIIDDVNLEDIPIQFCWPKDISPLITWGVAVTKGPSDEKIDNYNLGIYRLQPISKNKLIIRWLKMRGGAQQFQRWKSKTNKKFEISIFIGSDPSILLSAVMPIPDNMSEYNFAGLLKGRKIDLVKSLSNNLLVPASAEFVLEGEIDINELHDEGPFGDHTGYYNDVEKFPVVTIKKITQKSNPVYLTTYTGKPIDEPAILGKALNEVFVPIIQKQFPEITDFWLPPEGCSYRVAVISIKKTYPGQAKRIMMGAWSFLRQFMYTKYIIVVDEDIDIRNWKDVIWAISTRSDPSRDISIIDNTPIDYLDFSSPEEELGGKLGIDATNKIGSETKRNWGNPISMSDEIIKKIDEIFNEL